MTQPYEHVFSVFSRYFPRINISSENLQLLHKGRFANAMVFRYQQAEMDLVIKDFSHCAWPIRLTLGKFFIAQEANAFSKLKGIEGVAQQHYRLGKYTLAYPYIEGSPLNDFRRKGKKLPKDFFTKLERLVIRMHRRDVVHLDMRNMGNILCDSEGNPHLIDFQSSISILSIPHRLKKAMKGSDVSGIYKAWNLLCAEPVPGVKQSFFESYRNTRKWWIFKGYPFSTTFQKLHAGIAFLFSQNFVSWLVETFKI